nr:IS21 family transposase [Nocardia sp. BSTN01]
MLIDPFIDYCRIRLADDPHLWASTLFDEIVALGFTGSYQSLTTAIRKLELRPHCEPCHAARGRDVAIIAHPPGEETQWDWVELPDPPARWGSGRHAHLLVGALAHSSLWRGVLAPAEDFAHLVEALDQVTIRLGGVTRRWRFDRMSTVCYPESGRITPAFSGVAKHYSVGIDICPPRHGNRKGVVEKSNHAAAQRWWRTIGDDVSIAEAQVALDRLCARLDSRKRVRDGHRTTVGELAAAESLRPAPSAYPAEVREQRKVTAQGLVAWRGNQYSVPPGMPGALVTVIHRLGAEHLHLATSSGAIVAAHLRAPDGAGRVVRDEGHVVAMERSVLAAFDASKPCTHKTRRPISEAALAESARLRGHSGSADPAQKVVIDLAVYAATAARLSVAPQRVPIEQQEQ